MKGKKEKKQPTENENNNFPSLNSVISNLSLLLPNKITYQLMNTNKPKYRQKKILFLSKIQNQLRMAKVLLN